MKIYCDMDQVLVNFLAGARRALGREFNDPCLGTDKEKWALIQKVPGFWMHLEWMPGAQLLWDRIKHTEPHILSAAPQLEDAPTCKEEKQFWCIQQLSLPHERINIVQRSDKKTFAILKGTANLLIDDHPRNVAEWRDAGGLAILHHTIPETLKELDGYVF